MYGAGERSATPAIEAEKSRQLFQRNRSEWNSKRDMRHMAIIINDRPRRRYRRSGPSRSGSVIVRHVASNCGLSFQVSAKAVGKNLVHGLAAIDDPRVEEFLYIHHGQRERLRRHAMIHGKQRRGTHP